MCLLVIYSLLQVIIEKHTRQSPAPENRSLAPGHCCLKRVAFVMRVMV